MAINWAPQIRNTTNSIPNPPEKSKFDRKSLNVASFHLADSRWAKPLAFILTDTERIEKNVSDFKKRGFEKLPTKSHFWLESVVSARNLSWRDWGEKFSKKRNPKSKLNPKSKSNSKTKQKSIRYQKSTIPISKSGLNSKFKPKNLFHLLFQGLRSKLRKTGNEGWSGGLVPVQV